jgi:hypothetical protein
MFSRHLFGGSEWADPWKVSASIDNFWAEIWIEDHLNKSCQLNCDVHWCKYQETMLMAMTASVSTNVGKCWLRDRCWITRKHICTFGDTSSVTVMQIPLGILEPEFVYGLLALYCVRWWIHNKSAIPAEGNNKLAICLCWVSVYNIGCDEKQTCSVSHSRCMKVVQFLRVG